MMGAKSPRVSPPTTTGNVQPVRAQRLSWGGGSATKPAPLIMAEATSDGQHFGTPQRLELHIHNPEAPDPRDQLENVAATGTGV